MSDPYRNAKPGDAILAETWNQMQRDVRDHILTHTHTGGANSGTILTGASIDKSSTIEVQKVIATSSLTVGTIDVKTKFDALSAEKLSVAGGTISGPLSVTGLTSIGTALKLAAPPGDPSPMIATRTIPTGQGAANERTELIVFHGNDGTNGAGPDAITLRAPEIRLQTYDNGSVVSIDDAAGSNDRLVISPNGAATFKGDLTVSGHVSGPFNDYIRAQFTLSGGGTVSWANNRLKWTARFIVISMERPNSFQVGHANIYMPTVDIPAANTWDGVARSVTAEGVALGAWDALYAVHSIGGSEKSVELRVVNYQQPAFQIPNNWILVALFNADDLSVKLGTGETLNPGGSLLRSRLSANATGANVTGTLSAYHLNIGIDTRTGGTTAHRDPLGLYVTGNFTPDNGVEIRHSNGSQGIGFGYNTIYATGTNVDQDLCLKARGKSPVKVYGALAVSGSESFANANNYMATGSVTLGDIKKSFGGGSGWNTNTAGLLLETLRDTEIAVHDSGNRIASLMQFKGDSDNYVTIGRDMGWGPLAYVYVNCDLRARGALYEGNTAISSIYRRQDTPADSLRSTNGQYTIVMQSDRNFVLYSSNGSAVWSSGTNISDVALKRDITDIDHATEKLAAIRGVTFQWQDETLGTEREIGVIAQEVEAAFPEVVRSVDGKYKMVQYEKLVPVLIQALKEQKARIDELEARMGQRGAS